MRAETNAEWTLADWFVAAAIAVVAVSVASSLRTNFHVWGDDFSLYLLQAKAIGTGSMRAEVLTNSRILALSDVPVGPPAAPWGFPVILWLVAKIVGWGINDLKVVGVMSLATLACCAYALARNYCPRPGSAALAMLVAMQPQVLGLVDSVSSDVPFLAVSALALVAGERLVAPSAGDSRFQPGLTLLASILAVAGFSIRSQGAFLPVASFAILAYGAVSSSRERRRVLVYDAVLLLFATSVLVVLYFGIFPDGTLGQARAVTLAPQVLQRRFIEVIAGGAAFVPFSLMHRAGLLGPRLSALVCAACVAFFAIGAWRFRERSLGLVVFALLNLVLLLTYPVNGGARYLLPVLLPAVILCGAGVGSVLSSLHRSELFVAHAPRLAVMEHIALVALIAGMLAIIPVAFPDPPDYAISGPLTPVAESLFTFVRGRVPADNTVSFFKPRALRLFTGKLGIAVTRPENLDRADYVILDKRMRDGQWQAFFQLDRQTVESREPGRFVELYQNGQFVLYGKRNP